MAVEILNKGSIKMQIDLNLGGFSQARYFTQWKLPAKPSPHVIHAKYLLKSVSGLFDAGSKSSIS